MSDVVAQLLACLLVGEGGTRRRQPHCAREAAYWWRARCDAAMKTAEATTNKRFKLEEGAGLKC